MSTRIYANGVRATALTNIVADLATYVSNNTDGVLVVDREGLKAYLITQFAAISTTPEYVSPATASSSLAAARALSYDHLVDQLVDAIGVDHWTGRTDWPTGADVLQGASLVTAVKSAIAACKIAADSLTNYYADINSRLSDFVTSFYYGQGVDATVTPGVVRVVETRAVIHTYVSDRGEESAPSPASTLVDLDQNDTATYTLGESVPTGRNITAIRWYRSRSSNIGSDYAFVAESVSGTTTYTDSKKAEELGEPCPTITWAEPPATMIGVVEGPNGAHAGFFDNTFCPSENFVNYAYPEAYQKTTAWPIVGIGVFANTYVVTTRGKPYYVTGADSSSLDIQPIDSNYACSSRRSIVSVGSDSSAGVMYASPDGLCLASVEGVKLITEGMFSKKEWTALDPSSIFAAGYHDSYVFHCTAGCYALYLPDMTLRTLDATGSAFFRDLLTDTLYIASGTTIKSLFSAGTYRTATWKSKKATSAKHENWGWAQVYADGSVTLKVYRDGTLTDTKTITDSKPVRLSSKRALEHEIQIESAAKITSVTCAATAEQLRAL
jgi:hypothetical protein